MIYIFQDVDYNDDPIILAVLQGEGYSPSELVEMLQKYEMEALYYFNHNFPTQAISFSYDRSRVYCEKEIRLNTSGNEDPVFVPTEFLEEFRKVEAVKRKVWAKYTKMRLKFEDWFEGNNKKEKVINYLLSKGWKKIAYVSI